MTAPPGNRLCLRHRCAIMAALALLPATGCAGLGTSSDPPKPLTLNWDKGPTIFVAVDPVEPTGLRLLWADYRGSLRQAMTEFSILPASWNQHTRFGVFASGGTTSGRYQIYVRDAQGRMQRLVSVPSGTRTYVDTRAKPGERRVYQICREDENGKVLALSAPQTAVRGRSLTADFGFSREFAGPIPPDTSVIGWGKPAGGEAVADVDGRPGSPDDLFLRLVPPPKHTGATPVRVRLLSKQMRIQPGASYFQSGWIRARARAATVYVGRVWLDAKRRPLHASYMAVGVRCPRWTFFAQELVPGKRAINASDYRYRFGDWAYAIPPGARYCRLSIMADVTRTGADFDDFAFCEMRQRPVPADPRKPAAPPGRKPRRRRSRRDEFDE